MNKKIILILVLLLLFSILLIDYSYLQEKEKKELLVFSSVNKYLEHTDNGKMCYVKGLFDMYSYLVSCYFPELYYETIVKFNNMTPLQLKAIFDKYLEEHPEEWHFPVAEIFHKAIADL